MAGPTASGKTALAVELAEHLDGEIVNADSRQIYRGLDIGTAKPTAEERQRAPHHLLDVAGITERYSAGRYASDAGSAVADILGRKKTPIVCGGTGFYIQALVRPMFEEPEIDQEQRTRVREALEREAGQKGRRALHKRLARIDPESASRLHPNDFQRVSRALELHELTGRTMTELHGSQPGQEFAPFAVVLDPPVGEHDEWIGRRTSEMLDAGWEDEVRRLLDSGAPEDAPGFESLGYSDIIALVRGGTGRDEARENIALSTRQYARRQRTWFRRMEAALRDDPRRLEIGDVIRGWTEFQSNQHDRAIK